MWCCRVTLERAEPDDIYDSYATAWLSKLEGYRRSQGYKITMEGRAILVVGWPHMLSFIGTVHYLCDAVTTLECDTTFQTCSIMDAHCRTAISQH